MSVKTSNMLGFTVLYTTPSVRGGFEAVTWMTHSTAGLWKFCHFRIRHSYTMVTPTLTQILHANIEITAHENQFRMF